MTAVITDIQFMATIAFTNGPPIAFVRHLLMACNGLAPSRLIIYLSVSKRCPCWAHTTYKNNRAIVA